MNPRRIILNTTDHFTAAQWAFYRAEHRKLLEADPHPHAGHYAKAHDEITRQTLAMKSACDLFDS